jgi:signal transduction histidine kinase
LRSVVEVNRQKAPQIQIALDADGSLSSELPKAIEVQLLRIIQEALVNVRRHSEARNVEVSLREEDEDLIIEVVDDGRGFDPELAWGGIGLSSMQERALKLGADMHIQSAPGKGTKVIVRMPAELACAADAPDHSEIYREG